MKPKIKDSSSYPKEILPPTHMSTPNPVKEGAPYCARRVVTYNQIELHWHNFYEIDFLDGGLGTQILNGETHSFSRGTVTILGTTDFHAYTQDSENGESHPLSTYSFHFEQGFLESDMLSRFQSLAGHTYHIGDDEKYQSLLTEFQALFEECAGCRPLRDAFVRNILDRILLLLHRALDGNENTPSQSTSLPYPEMKIIEERFRQQLTASEVASAIGYSTNYFGKLFCRRYGLTFQEYLLERRLQWAYSVLRASSVSIAEIAYESGFNSQSYFTRQFRRKYGMSPTQVRQSLAGEDKTHATY